MRQFTADELASAQAKLEEIRQRRKCGTCYACCVWLGIKELQKWSGQACRHLDGRNPERRCSIYDHNPQACQDYYCAWMGGFGDEDMRPNECGVLVTIYDGPQFSATVHVIDAVKAGQLTKDGSPLLRICQALILSGCNDVRITLAGNAPGQSVLHLRDGKIWRGKLLKPPPGEYEMLGFEFHETPVGTLKIEELK